jgi:hypothetical protein
MIFSRIAVLSPCRSGATMSSRAKRPTASAADQPNTFSAHPFQ